MFFAIGIVLMFISFSIFSMFEDSMPKYGWKPAVVEIVGWVGSILTIVSLAHFGYYNML